MDVEREKERRGSSAQCKGKGKRWRWRPREGREDHNGRGEKGTDKAVQQEGKIGKQADGWTEVQARWRWRQAGGKQTATKPKRGPGDTAHGGREPRGDAPGGGRYGLAGQPLLNRQLVGACAMEGEHRGEEAMVASPGKKLTSRVQAVCVSGGQKETKIGEPLY